MAKQREKFSPEFKTQVVLEILSGAKSAAEVCREYGIRSQLVSKWMAHLLERAASVFEERNGLHPAEKSRIAELSVWPAARRWKSRC